MQLFAIASAFLTMLAGTWVGLRLFLLSKRTGQRPERLIGIGMLSFGAVAYPMFLLLVTSASALPAWAAIGLSIGANTAYFICLVALALFTRVVFRPESALGALLVGIIAVIGLCGSGLSAWSGIQHSGISPALDPLMRWGGAMIGTSFALAFCWASIEAFAYRTSLRKRLALGLSDPVVVNRFSVWVLGTGVSAIVDIGLVVTSITGIDPTTNPIPALLQSTSGLACAITWTLTFAPSEMYLNWVRTRAARATEAIDQA